MKKAGHMRGIEVMIVTIKISEVETTLEMIGIEVNVIEVDRRNFIDRDRLYDRGRGRDRATRGGFGTNRRYTGSRNRGRSTARDKVRREGVITFKNQDILGSR